ncbi:MAG: ATPase [delta proteobacterium ML8_F1]|nr:MAG: ATPase [delta proteobacterium ML8_F1]
MKWIVALSMIIVLGTIITGVVLMKGSVPHDRGRLRKYLAANLLTYAPLLAGTLAFLVPEVSYALEEPTSASGLGYIAAALSTGMATIGAGYAVGAVGSSALGAVSEDPKILGKTLIYVGLAEGIAIYGLIISILILGAL